MSLELKAIGAGIGDIGIKKIGKKEPEDIYQLLILMTGKRIYHGNPFGNGRSKEWK